MSNLRFPFVPAHLLSLLVWATVAFTAVGWGLRWSAGGSSLESAAAASPASTDIDPAAVLRGLGGVPVAATAAPSLASRFQLVGAVAGGPLQGAALLAIDGKPAKPYRVGAVVLDGWVLQSVQPRRVSLGATASGPAALTLDLPVKNQQSGPLASPSAAQIVPLAPAPLASSAMPQTLPDAAPPAFLGAPTGTRPAL